MYVQVCSPKRLHLKLEEGKIQTPELINDLDLPDTLAVLGQSVDLTQVWKPLMSAFLDKVANSVQYAVLVRFNEVFKTLKLVVIMSARWAGVVKEQCEHSP
eukprot:1160626-Pelagomonas_calceolata.AAC.4